MDSQRLQFLQEENEDLQRRLARATYRMERVDSDFKASHEHLETQLRKAQAELEELKAKFHRLQENYSRAEQVNTLMEENLYAILPRPSLLSKVVSERGQDQLNIAVNQSPFLNVPVFTPPAPFMDEGPGMDVEDPNRSACSTARAVATPPAADQLLRGLAAAPEGSGSHRLGGQRFLPSREGPSGPLRTRPVVGPHRQTAFTPWRPCLDPTPPLSRLGGDKPQAVGGKPEEGCPPPAAGFAVFPSDPFGPINPMEHPALGTISEELIPKEMSWKDVNARPCLSLGEVSSSAGSGDEVADGWSKVSAGKIAADAERGQGLNYQPGLSDTAKVSQRRGHSSPRDSEGKGEAGNHSPSLGLPGANCDPSPPTGLAGGRDWGEEVVRRLFEAGGRGRDGDATGRPQEGGRAFGGEGHAREGAEEPARHQSSSKHPPATAPRKHRHQASRGPVARE
ncbi:tight junction-associated protein 1-like [Scyliorhinus canicula]|uniref:tight junction-associated protein 1-like n=1 Tax=Scyliorhinus canicula TaxID=7830 RepID=UPI0018F57D35|nr:tight junction-associated protein 1-like [Scyliorhinus canicula]